jgi:hypothetical protein
MDNLTHILEQETEPEAQTYYGENENLILGYVLQFEWNIPGGHVLDYMDCHTLECEGESVAQDRFLKEDEMASDMEMEFHGQTITGRWSLD